MPSVNGLPYPALSDPNNPPADFLALATAVDARFGSHTHSADQVISGTLPIVRGGTGGSTVAAAQSALNVGLVPISPTSVTYSGTSASASASANTRGLVSFTNCYQVTLNGVFSSTYKAYVVQFRATQIDAGADQLHTFRLANGGTGVATNYNGGHTLNYFNTTTLVANGGYSQTYQVIGRTYTTGGNAYAVVNIVNPAEAAFTYFSGTGQGTTASSGGMSLFGGVHATATAYDGLQFFTSAYNASGTIQVFGLLN